MKDAKGNKIGPGTVLTGFCNGYFGRDSYDDKTVVAIGEHNGINWVVVSTGYTFVVDGEYQENKYLAFASGFSKKDIKNWTDEEYD